MSFLHIPASSGQAPMGQGRIGVLLINLGTPSDTGYSGVRRYLSEFLSDQRVIEASPVVWQPVLQGVVLTVRPGKSGAAYKRIWNTERDESPLLTFTREQGERLAERFGGEPVTVAWGMRYGVPSVSESVRSLLEAGCDRILAVPLYPQYSATTTATANDQLFRFLMQLRRQPAIRTMPAFPDHPAYIRALASIARTTLAELAQPPQMIVTSFHGLPKQYVEKGDPYYEDCVRTVTALRAEMGMTEETMPLTFQSRFGPAKWLEPYTAPFIAGLPAKGIRRIAVIMPGFMTDCIETLDEIGNEVRHEFIQAGGEEFTLIPCLNGSDEAITLLETLVRSELGGWLS